MQHPRPGLLPRFCQRRASLLRPPEHALSLRRAIISSVMPNLASPRRTSSSPGPACSSLQNGWPGGIYRRRGPPDVGKTRFFLMMAAGNCPSLRARRRKPLRNRWVAAFGIAVISFSWAPKPASPRSRFAPGFGSFAVRSGSVSLGDPADGGPIHGSASLFPKSSCGG